MSRRPEDPRVTDLRRYRKARELQRRQQAARRPPSEGLLGSRPRAGLILVLVLLGLAALSLGPSLLHSGLLR
jgi:anti-sigma factor RsiW